MFQSGGTRSHPQGAVLLGVAGGMAVVAAGFFTGYLVLDSQHEARAATPTEPPRPVVEPRAAGTGAVPAGLAGYLARPVELVTAHGSGPILSAANSCPVNTAATPGIWRAASTLIAAIRACACGERTTTP